MNSIASKLLRIVGSTWPYGFLLVSAAWGFTANQEDTYVACLVGQAAVGLHKTWPKCNIKTAEEFAFRSCNPPKNLSQESIEGIGDYANMMISQMASGCQ